MVCIKEKKEGDMGRPKLKNEAKRRVSKSISIRKDILVFVETSEEGVSKTLENAVRSSREVSKLLGEFYSKPKSFESKDAMIELIEAIDDASSLFATSFEGDDEDQEEEESSFFSEAKMPATQGR